MAMRKPDGREWRRLGLEMGERAQRLVAIGLEEVHAQIDRRALSERPALLGRGRAEARLELSAKPFGEIAGHVRGRACQVRGCEPLAFGFGELRRRVALAGEQSGDCVRIEALRLSQRAQDLGARSGVAHDPGRRAFLPQRIIDEARDRRPVARASEAVREAPVLHRVGRGAAAEFDIRQNFDRGGGAGGGDHGRGAFGV